MQCCFENETQGKTLKCGQMHRSEAKVLRQSQRRGCDQSNYDIVKGALIQSVAGSRYSLLFLGYKSCLSTLLGNGADEAPGTEVWSLDELFK